MLHITRTFLDSQGRTYEQEEFIRQNDSVIQSYVKIRRTKSEKFMWVTKFCSMTMFTDTFPSRKSYYALDEIERERLKRERRRLQEQLRRVKRNEIRYDQYEKQEMLFRIQQENLALLQSKSSTLSSTRSETSDQRVFPEYDLNLSDEESSSSMIN